MAFPKWKYPKDPDETLDYAVDWSRQMEADSDTIAASEWEIPDGLTLESESFTDDRTQITLSGGTAGTRYDCVNTITTAGSRVYSRTITLMVEDR